MYSHSIPRSNVILFHSNIIFHDDVIIFEKNVNKTLKIW